MTSLKGRDFATLCHNSRLIHNSSRISRGRSFEALDDFTRANKLPDIKAASDIEDPFVAAFWAQKNALPPVLQHPWQSLLSGFADRKGKVEAIQKNLEALGLNVTPLDGNTDPDDSVQLVFLDYILDEIEAEGAPERSQLYAKRLSQRGAKSPFVVLMSDRPGAVEHEQSFRDVTGQLGGTFAFLPKQDGVDPDTLYFRLGSWGIGHPAHTNIQVFVNATLDAAEEAMLAFRAAIKKLTVQDFAFLQRISLDRDGQPLGDYMVELFGAVFSFEYRNNPQVQAARKSLDKLRFPQHLPFSKALTKQLAEVYRCALTEPGIGPVGPHPWEDVKIVSASYGSGIPETTTAPPAEIPTAVEAEKPAAEISAPEPSAPAETISSAASTAPSTLMLALGDIFARDDAPAGVRMLISPACDLQFSIAPAKRKWNPDLPVYLIPGVLKSLHDPTDRRFKRTELFYHKGQSSRIEWDHTRVESIRLGTFQSAFLNDGFTRIARLNMNHALEIQRAWTAHLDRVGSPVPPPLYELADLRVYLRNDGEWESLGEAIHDGAVIFWRQKSEDKVEKTYVLTHEGLVALQSNLSAAAVRFRQLSESVDANSPNGEKTRDRLQKKAEKAEKGSADVRWRLRLLEEDNKLPDKGGSGLVGDSWICFEVNEGEHPKPKDVENAAILIDICRAASAAVGSASDVPAQEAAVDCIPCS